MNIEWRKGPACFNALAKGLAFPNFWSSSFGWEEEELEELCINLGP
jgi:hypothetical protein